MGAGDIKEIKTIDEFLECINTHSYVLVDFYADWCGPCKMIAPKIQELPEKYKDKNIYVVKVDVDDANDLAAEYDIKAMPTFKLFVGGKEKCSITGADIGKVEEAIKTYFV
jgi:thioredoxin 1